MKRIFIAMAVCAVLGAWAQTPAKESAKVLSSASGRFVFGQISEYRRDQYLLDTQTGRLWQIVQVNYKKDDGTDGTYQKLDAVPFDQNPVFPLPK